MQYDIDRIEHDRNVKNDMVTTIKSMIEILYVCTSFQH